jgi:hypothetical protein
MSTDREKRKEPFYTQKFGRVISNYRVKLQRNVGEKLCVLNPAV